MLPAPMMTAGQVRLGRNTEYIGEPLDLAQHSLNLSIPVVGSQSSNAWSSIHQTARRADQMQMQKKEAEEKIKKKKRKK